MQTVLFWLEHNEWKWELPHVIYFLSSSASLISIIKAIYVYNIRYEVVIRGFEEGRTGVDDAALALVLFKEGKFDKLDKVLSRMELHGTDIGVWDKDDLKNDLEKTRNK